MSNQEKQEYQFNAKSWQYAGPGGREVGSMIEEGFMQVRTLEDPDGHYCGISCLDLGKYREVTGK